jgi:oligoribonuclease NrnB/cAMP/cGMP phosphodiesterase (DHH superfamily)
MWHASTKGVKIGLRSRSEFNCIPLAESFGGGGHAQACGFKMGNERLVELLGGVLKADAGTDYAYVPAPGLEQPEDGVPAESAG